MLKRSLIAASSVALTAALVSPAFAAPADFVGTWVNTNSNTRGITRVVVTSAGSNALNVQVFGKCSPTDCDWGKTTLLTYGNNVQDANHRFATASYDKGFSKTIVTFSLQGNKQISLQNFTQFTDKSGRQNYASQEVLKR
jgi:hypothetical protein